ncbi:hypothetical protein MAPG_07362 [Magnaporthiopsis poae ATCC 64411]|uniref:Uncharacterized protein n=1 Tax=Magnaporthiopsis poae (strain ATCC 64411 / 73-15) TaxID=644358 RepID=A0A0C4E4G8_MAGP6|nr:hypothetical protein MAPG_07362 [Magnaporthiopsis poae ATCC 64411]
MDRCNRRTWWGRNDATLSRLARVCCQPAGLALRCLPQALWGRTTSAVTASYIHLLARLPTLSLSLACWIRDKAPCSRRKHQSAGNTQDKTRQDAARHYHPPIALQRAAIHQHHHPPHPHITSPLLLSTPIVPHAPPEGGLRKWCCEGISMRAATPPFLLVCSAAECRTDLCMRPPRHGLGDIRGNITFLVCVFRFVRLSPESVLRHSNHALSQ